MPDLCIQYPQIADDQRLLLDRLLELRDRIIRQAPARLANHADDFPDGRFTHSAINLAHYLALRREDLRGVQDRSPHLACPRWDAARRTFLTT